MVAYIYEAIFTLFSVMTSILRLHKAYLEKANKSSFLYNSDITEVEEPIKIKNCASEPKGKILMSDYL